MIDPHQSSQGGGDRIAPPLLNIAFGLEKHTMDGLERPGRRRFWCQPVRLFLIADLGMALAALGLDLSQLYLYDITILLGSGSGDVRGKC